jgi:tryptophan 7-halogenase
VRPKRYDALAEAVPIAEIQAHFERLRTVMLKAVAGVPPHAETLARHCPAKAREHAT